MGSLSPCRLFSFQAWHHTGLTFRLNHFIYKDISRSVPTQKGFSSKLQAALFPLLFSPALKSKLPQCLGFHQDIHNLSPKVQTSCSCVQSVCAHGCTCICICSTKPRFWLPGPQQEIVYKWFWPHVINLPAAQHAYFIASNLLSTQSNYIHINIIYFRAERV